MHSEHEEEKWICRKIALEGTSGDCLVCLLVQDGIKAKVDASRTCPERLLMLVTSHLL